jgi:hypothetical protein
MVLTDVVGRDVWKRSFQPVADLDRHLAIADKNENRNAISLRL